jgi:hypothetical protein
MMWNFGAFVVPSPPKMAGIQPVDPLLKGAELVGTMVAKENTPVDHYVNRIHDAKLTGMEVIGTTGAMKHVPAQDYAPPEPAQHQSPPNWFVTGYPITLHSNWVCHSTQAIINPTVRILVIVLSLGPYRVVIPMTTNIMSRATKSGIHENGVSQPGSTPMYCSSGIFGGSLDEQGASQFFQYCQEGPNMDYNHMGYGCSACLSDSKTCKKSQN